MQPDTASIREHMEILDAEGVHVGTVDKLDGDRIKLTRNDRGAGGEHHWIPLSLVADTEGNRLRLSTTLDRLSLFQQAGNSGGTRPNAPSGADSRHGPDAPAGAHGSNLGQGGPSMT